MLISSALAAAINAQIGNELAASLQYHQIAAHFHEMHLVQLATLFHKQAAEEREHAEKLLKYVLETGGGLRIPAVREPVHTFPTAEAAVGAALSWEKEVTGQIKGSWTSLRPRATTSRRASCSGSSTSSWRR
jgi:bacterioferritin B